MLRPKSHATLGTPIRFTVLVLAMLMVPSESHAFCGFFVSKADSKMFNEASQVVLVRDGNRTAITMVNDFQGKPKDFAMVIPVPTFIEREQINVGDMAVVDHLDAFTAPRLVEYHDSNPCAMRDLPYDDAEMAAPMASAGPRRRGGSSAQSLGVKIEASYTVGEYDIMILSATQSSGLITWLSGNGYRIPNGAEPVVKSYMRQGMRFFVARVNLGKHEALGTQKLRPIQVAYESRKFMLPIRLGMVNAKAQQELIVYALSKKGRVESTNYRTAKLPSNMDVPLFVRDDFAKFYTDMFRHQTKMNQSRVIFTEYAWDMSWCDPCAASPLTGDELRKLGVFWAKRGGGPAQNVFVTRLHVRYDARHFPSDLVFHETGDRQNFQGRYVLRNPAKGDLSCQAGQSYKKQLATRWKGDAKTLAKLTGWPLSEIESRIDWSLTEAPDGPWWKSVWE